jgi:tetratricopeptide (TPR) repeat protein
LASVYATTCRIQEALDCITPLLARVGEGGDGEVSRCNAKLYRSMIDICYVGSRFTDCLQYATRLEELGHTLHDENILCEAALGRTNALYQLGDLPEALRIGQEAAVRAERVGDLLSLTYTLHALSLVCQAVGDLDQDATWNARAQAAAERLGQPQPLIHTYSRTGKHALCAGDWDQARADFERAYAMDQEIGISWSSPHALFDLGHLGLVTGRTDEGVQRLEQAIMLAHRWNDLQALHYAQAVLAEYDLLESQPESARLRLLPLLERGEQQVTAVTRLLPLLAWAHLESGNIAEAQTFLSAAHDRASEHGMRPTLSAALRVQAQLDLHLARVREARGALEGALALSRTISYPYLEAKALYVYGLFEAARGQVAQARVRHEQAAAICGRLGELPYRRCIKRALADLADPADPPDLADRSPR